LFISNKNIVKDPINTPVADDLQNHATLQKLVGKLIIGLLPISCRQKSFIINDVPPEARVCADENMLAHVLSGLLAKAVANTSNECIRVGATLTGDCTIIKVKDSDGNFYNTASRYLQQVQLVAEKMGGCININQNKIGGTLTTFSFYNRSNVA
jgi:hypothetical protein